jgi:hypothetical protein
MIHVTSKLVSSATTAPVIDMLRIEIAHCSLVASEVDDASNDTSAGSAPEATIEPRNDSAKMTSNNKIRYTDQMQFLVRCQHCVCTLPRKKYSVAHNSSRATNAPEVEMLRIANTHCSLVASDAEDARIDTSNGSAPASMIGPQYASAETRMPVIVKPVSL